MSTSGDGPAAVPDVRVELVGRAGGWEADLEARYGLPLEQIPGRVYVLHYDLPQVAKSVSSDYAGPSPRADRDGWLSARPIRHYVGWTQQARPSKRYTRHGPAALRDLVYLEPGTMADEQALKLAGTCPKCGEAYAADLSSREERIAQAAEALRRVRQQHDVLRALLERQRQDASEPAE